MTFFDAHNHLQDGRFAGQQARLVSEAVAAGVGRMVVNGSSQADWPHVAALAEAHSEVLPSFGCHPWYLGEQSSHWESELLGWLDRFPNAGVGEIGLDRWCLENPERWRVLAQVGAEVNPPPRAQQEEFFRIQWRFAVERQRPASLHCLQTFGRLLEMLSEEQRLSRGFLLHSYGGPTELISPFVKLGAYFSFPGYFAHPRKARQAETFRHVPADRLLVETDAPDQLPPAECIRFALTGDPGGSPLNHPANLGAIYEFLAEQRGCRVEELAAQVGENFHRLFGESRGPTGTP